MLSMQLGSIQIIAKIQLTKREKLQKRSRWMHPEHSLPGTNLLSGKNSTYKQLPIQFRI